MVSLRVQFLVSGFFFFFNKLPTKNNY
jgi:hypothetical protein